MKNMDLASLAKHRFEYDFDKPDSYSYVQDTAASRFLLRHLIEKENALEKTSIVTKATESKTKYIAKLNQLNAYLDSPVAIEGTLKQVPYVEWLNIERILTEQQMRLFHGKGSPLAEHVRKSSTKLDSNHEAVKLFFGPNRVVWGSVATAMISNLTAIATIPNKLLISEFSQLPLVPMTATGVMIAAACGAVVSGMHRNWVSGRLSRVIVDSVSDSWEDVFLLKTPSDALLLGTIRDTFDATRHLDVVPPDFMSVTPKQAFQILKTFSKDSVNTNQYVDWFRRMCIPIEKEDESLVNSSFTRQSSTKINDPVPASVPVHTNVPS